MKKSKTLGLILLSCFVIGIAAVLLLRKGTQMEYKPAQKIPHPHEIHGDVRPDDYFWMRERDSEPVLAFLRQENARTEEALRPLQKLETKLYNEMRARIKENDASVPQKIDNYFYYTRYETGQEYAIHCRRKGSMEAKEEILLNENELAKGHDYFDVADFEISPDHRMLAFAVDTVGRRIYEIRFRDLQTGEFLKDRIEVTTGSMTWAKDNKTLFFVRQDLETLRAFQLLRYEIGTGGNPELVYEEKDTTYSIDVNGSKTDNHILLAIQKRDSSEWRMLDSANPKGEWRILQPREMKHEYFVVEAGDRLLVMTNWKAKNFRVMEAKLDSTSKEQWKEILAHDPKRLLTGLDVYENYFVIAERENALGQIRVRDRKTGKDRMLSFPDSAYELTPIELDDYKSPIMRFAYETLIQPTTTYDEDMKTGERTLRKEREVPTYDRSKYVTERIWATAKDGTKVPLSLAYRKDLKKNGKNPTLLYGYGSYGFSNDVRFWGSMVSLMDRGFVFASSHIRGGSEMGREWYEQGRLKNKMNTFTDFIACGEKLIEDGYTSKDHLHIMGGSAGGLLMGAVMNMRPDLFKSVSAGVPFVDVLTTMLDESIPLTTSEYNEWGDPRKKDEYMYMRQYSPYDNVEKKAYPHLFITTGYHDSQVQYWEPAKWLAKLREFKTDQNQLLMYTEMEAGHSGASGRFEALKMLAKEFTFILMVEGIKE